ncbi:hypothetical protein [Candidatus Pantoea soli]|uniref:hypothetical protein n=1 Tax=Candidatus Pantoea soli TaxID=3098669 RepID=UPI0016472933|nr:hypothetical protein [Pantoea soli]
MEKASLRAGFFIAGAPPGAVDRPCRIRFLSPETLAPSPAPPAVSGADGNHHVAGQRG